MREIKKRIVRLVHIVLNQFNTSRTKSWDDRRNCNVRRVDLTSGLGRSEVWPVLEISGERRTPANSQSVRVVQTGETAETPSQTPDRRYQETNSGELCKDLMYIVIWNILLKYKPWNIKKFHPDRDQGIYSRLSVINIATKLEMINEVISNADKTISDRPQIIQVKSHLTLCSAGTIRENLSYQNYQVIKYKLSHFGNHWKNAFQIWILLNLFRNYENSLSLSVVLYFTFWYCFKNTNSALSNIDVCIDFLLYLSYEFIWFRQLPIHFSPTFDLMNDFILIDLPLQSDVFTSFQSSSPGGRSHFPSLQVQGQVHTWSWSKPNYDIQTSCHIPLSVVFIPNVQARIKTLVLDDDDSCFKTCS